MLTPQQLYPLEKKYGLPSGLLSAVMHQESGGNPGAVSPRGAQGLFQFMPDTAKSYGIDPNDPMQAADGAARMYADLSKQYNGDLPSMLAAYNWGSGNLAKQGLASAPEETQNYIKSVTSALPQYAQAAPQTTTDAVVDNSSQLLEIEMPDGTIMTDIPAGTPRETIEKAWLAAGGKMPEAQQPTAPEPQAPVQEAAKPSYFDRVKDAYVGANKRAAATLMAPFVGEENRQVWEQSGVLSSGKPENFAQSINQGPVGIGTAALYSMAAPLAPAMEDLSNYAVKKGVVTPSQLENFQALMNIAGPAGMRGVGKALQGKSVTLPTIGQESKGIIPESMPKLLAQKAPAYDPIKGVAAMADNYATQSKTAGQLYKAVDEIATGKPINTEGLATDIGGLIDDIKADPFHEARGTLPKLQALQNKLVETIPEKHGTPTAGGIPVQGVKEVGKFDLADAMELKKTMNEAFKPARWNQNAKGTVYGDLGAKVGAILDDAAQKYPDFGEAKSLADKYWLNNVQNAFKDNAVLAKYFKIDDLREIQALREGRVAELHPETLARAKATLKNIKTETDLNTLRKVLPENLSQSLAKDVLKAQGSSGRLSAAGKLATGILDVRPHGIARSVGNLADLIAGVEKTPEQMALIEAAKSPKPKLLGVEELKKLGKKP